jgi:Ca2+-binding RTX toxin-like protein
LNGEEDNDTSFGEGGNDFIFDVNDGSRDEMNGGGGVDFLEGWRGRDILRGQEGDDNGLGAFSPSMFGDEGNDELYGGPGEDGMEGEEGTDQHFGEGGNDFIDAASNEDPMTDAPDVVNCGGGFDTAVVRPNDIVSGNCEDVIELTTIVAEARTADDEEQQQQADAFLAERGGGR